MRKHVKPADKAASIPDPARKTDLPPEGRVVEWSAHWARLEARGDIKAKDVPDGDSADTKVEKPKAAADAGAGANPQAEAPKAATSGAPSGRTTNP
ncbi:DUF2635 domain-containing protein [Methylobacterium sp. 391_Methyba4]|uniref:DUF2635 domain-containing protein n=1 Tax=Methylobacterium sp. 391_Methyba4 TaxID=3038924 RepID=UPI00241FF05E|nr:DUF2635 domain-containing protein [Methylobacterium sp. 391_Methyba4]WFS07777.1 DUF2635 domain-containing protein [Methylobacterium sp. 391_Methyba4]